MRLGIISDTHGLLRPEVFDAFAGVDLILHAGDIGSTDSGPIDAGAIDTGPIDTGPPDPATNPVVMN